MRQLALLLLLALTCDDAHAAWSPPANPNPQLILNEAQADATGGRYADALARHMWFHEHALEVEPAMAGVRLSFALLYWHRLGDQYPPAKAKMVEYRDRARDDVLAGRNVRQAFMDLDALNKELGQRAASAEVFRQLDQRYPQLAPETFRSASPSLVLTKSYDLLAKYAKPPEDYARMVADFRSTRAMSSDPAVAAGNQLNNYAERSFATRVMTLVAVLVLAERGGEAKEIAASARAEWNSAWFAAGLDDALKGVVPPPWP
jgi:hypothetical protein